MHAVRHPVSGGDLHRPHMMALEICYILEVDQVIMVSTWPMHNL